MTKDEALNLALDFITESNRSSQFWLVPASNLNKTVTAIREALAQPEQEPVIWMYQDKSTHEVQFQKHMRSFVDHSKTSEVPLYSEPLANHELQCVCGAVWCGDEMVHLPNKIPPQRKPLTDEEIAKLADDFLAYQIEDYQVSGVFNFARAIEAAHGIKE